MGRFLRWFFFASLSAILLLQLRSIDAPLRLDTTPLGIVSYEFAFTASRAAAMIGAWRAAGVLESALVSLGVDVAFLLVYPWFFRSSVQLLARRNANGRTSFERVGVQLAALVLFCTPLDLIENLALWRMIAAAPSTMLAVIAGIAATLKFVLVVGTGGWCLVSLSRRIGASTTSSSSAA